MIEEDSLTIVYLIISELSDGLFIFNWFIIAFICSEEEIRIQRSLNYLFHDWNWLSERLDTEGQGLEIEGDNITSL